MLERRRRKLTNLRSTGIAVTNCVFQLSEFKGHLLMTVKNTKSETDTHLIGIDELREIGQAFLEFATIIDPPYNPEHYVSSEHAVTIVPLDPSEGE